MTTKTILVVDDEKRLRDLVKAYLEAEGFRVVTAGDGQEALYVARYEKPDLILLDLMMPVLDGYGFMRAYSKEQDTGRRGPSGPDGPSGVIILTAKVEEGDKVLGLELGADDYVTKPFSLRELTARCEPYCAGPTKRPPRPTSCAAPPCMAAASSSTAAVAW